MRTVPSGIAFNSAGSPANVARGLKRRRSCAVRRPCYRNPSSLLANRIQSFVVSSRATALSQRKVWALLPAINSFCPSVPKNPKNPLFFTSLWNTLPASDHQKAAFLSLLQELADPKAPSLIYYLTLFQIFKDLGDELDEERIVKSATGIRNTTVWKKLYKFQRDGVVGAIDKLERLGGCIIADSVGLGKTFEALAIIKYYELRNERVLVLCPKKLRENWTVYRHNDALNPFIR